MKLTRRINDIFGAKGWSEEEIFAAQDEWWLESDPDLPLERACKDVDPSLWR